MPDGITLTPLQASSGLYCELAFNSSEAEEIDVLIFTDERGYLSGIDVTYGFANHAPLPEGIAVTGLKGVWGSGGSGA